MKQHKSEAAYCYLKASLLDHPEARQRFDSLHTRCRNDAQKRMTSVPPTSLISLSSESSSLPVITDSQASEVNSAEDPY